MFLDTQKQIKNQKLSDYEIIDFINNHIDSTQKDSIIDRIIDYTKDTKNLR
ncbi:TPA: hypothetical protein SB288_001663 [Campylobacter coli]|nr:hypothetical protein [Campylobacter coli]